MPYISNDTRNKLKLGASPATAGDLNFTITKILHNYLEECDWGYSSINLVIGVLECAKLELYRTVAAPYEDTKKEQNGPISTLDDPERYK